MKRKIGIQSKVQCMADEVLYRCRWIWWWFWWRAGMVWVAVAMCIAATVFIFYKDVTFDPNTLPVYLAHVSLNQTSAQEESMIDYCKATALFCKVNHDNSITVQVRSRNNNYIDNFCNPIITGVVCYPVISSNLS